MTAARRQRRAVRAAVRDGLARALRRSRRPVAAGAPSRVRRPIRWHGATGIVEIHDIGEGVWISTTRRPPERAYGRGVIEPPIPAGRRGAAAAARLQTLTAWRRGARLALALAPAAAAAGLLAPGACAVTLGAALLLAAATETAARDALRACVMCPELRALPAAERERARLTGAAHRRRLAHALRRTARHRPRSAQERRLSPYPPQRLAAPPPRLFELAHALEAPPPPHPPRPARNKTPPIGRPPEPPPPPPPAVLAEIKPLLCAGARSPLLTRATPAAELPAPLRRLRHRLATDTAPPDASPPVARRRHGSTRPRAHRTRTPDRARRPPLI